MHANKPVQVMTGVYVPSFKCLPALIRKYQTKISNVLRNNRKYKKCTLALLFKTFSKINVFALASK
jgi:hypothetical protein